MHIQATVEYFAANHDEVYHTDTFYLESSAEAERKVSRQHILETASRLERDYIASTIENNLERDALTITSASITVERVTQSNPVNTEEHSSLWTTRHALSPYGLKR